ncbi:hypothetical protein BU23DRAFT_563337 [Bimuria novae-zelandiae CBS 107.79]|uniref:Uncharacterized protein n=1 Tax=Bimuria novae-zelandiae CBS 107.79 TaxID=1447943 RepID=A0A6A5VQN2_9PLEO|nr:hypothetical protein BU23DRAFT_563337 [Bimuria novae-zelandiae CBS 107.79]
MSPIIRISRDADPNIVGHQPRPRTPEGLIIEAWAQGYLVGSLIIMIFITLANMRRGVLLHKLLLGIWQGFWLFPGGKASNWWLSAAAILLNMSWVLHNFISWLKIKPFLSRFWSLVFLYTCVLTFPYWVIELYANFTYFNGTSNWFKKTRPLELLFRDPWWIITTVYLFYIIKNHYAMTLRDIIRISPRFGIMLTSMIISISFVICDVCSVTGAIKLAGGADTGINPFWKLAFVFKCLTDSVILDDFKMALDRLRAFKISRLGSYSIDDSDRRMRNGNNLVQTWETAEREAREKQHNLLEVGTSSEDQALHGNANGNGNAAANFKLSFDQNGKQKSTGLPDREQSFFQQGEQYRDPLSMVRSAFDDESPSTPSVDPTQEPNKPGEGRSQPLYDESDAQDIDVRDLYADAQRDVEGHHPLASSARHSHTRRSHTTV